ncbi:MAG TPA: hypothetical protein VK674_06490 [Candidatus Limnocylindria bacterium]|nr:hypothetical protein [Candidatus Limnocylindria bacterium]
MKKSDVLNLSRENRKQADLEAERIEGASQARSALLSKVGETLGITIMDMRRPSSGFGVMVSGASAEKFLAPSVTEAATFLAEKGDMPAMMLAVHAETTGSSIEAGCTVYGLAQTPYALDGATGELRMVGEGSRLDTDVSSWEKIRKGALRDADPAAKGNFDDFVAQVGSFAETLEEFPVAIKLSSVNNPQDLGAAMLNHLGLGRDGTIHLA